MKKHETAAEQAIITTKTLILDAMMWLFVGFETSKAIFWTI
jgi:hypothetical protein